MLLSPPAERGQQDNIGSPGFMVWHVNPVFFISRPADRSRKERLKSVKISRNQESQVERLSFHSTDPQLFASLLPFVVFWLDEIAVS